jgi:hypothetical protein
MVGETGDVLALRARGGNASPRRNLPSFVTRCAAAIPIEARPRYQHWIRVDSAGFSEAVVDAATKHSAIFSITCVQNKRVRRAIEALTTDPTTTWVPAKEPGNEIIGSEVAETTYRFPRPAQHVAVGHRAVR